MFEFGEDVEVGAASGETVAAGDAGGAVFGEGGVFGAGAGEVVVVEGVAFVAEDVGDGDVLGTVGDAGGTEEAGGAFIVGGEEAEGLAVVAAQGGGGGGAEVLLQVIKIFGVDDGGGDVGVAHEPFDHGGGRGAAGVFGVGEEGFHVGVGGGPADAAHGFHADDAEVLLFGEGNDIGDLLAVAVGVEELGGLEGGVVHEVGEDVVGHVAADVVVVVLGDGEVFDEAFFFEAVKGAVDAEFGFGLLDGVEAEVEFKDVVVADAGALDGVFDVLVVLFLVDVAAFVVAADAVDDDFEVVGFAGLAFEGVGKGCGGPFLGFVPVVDAGLDGEGDDVGAPVGGADEGADLEAGAAVAAEGEFGEGGGGIGGGEVEGTEAGEGEAGGTGGAGPEEVAAVQALVKIVMVFHSGVLKGKRGLEGGRLQPI